MKSCISGGPVFFSVAAARSVLLLLVLALGACAVGPDYQRPGVAVGTSYKEIQGWKIAEPADAGLRADWWREYQDPVLDRLMASVQADNLSVMQAEAQYRQAQALLKSARSSFFPFVDTAASVTRSGSGNGGNGGTGAGSGFSNPSNQFVLDGAVSWEPDLWGRVRRSVESSRAALAASGADIAATRLSMQSTLAQTYFRLRAADAERDLLAQTVAAYEQSLRTTQNRYEAGVAAPADVAVSRTQLENTRAEYIATEWQRAQFEHAIAVLTGRAPSDFGIEVTNKVGGVPAIPVGMPSQLLERRPDVAAAERRAAEANARIGVAQAAWFPVLTLSAQAGYRSGQWAQWLTAPASFWSLGPALALTLFDAGARQAGVDEARATYDAQVAGYRLTVLTALREVEDFLVELHVLGQQQETQAIALASARESLRLTRNQYEAGLIDYLSVVQVETTALNTERAALSLQAARLVASVQLIAALGGGWQGALDGSLTPAVEVGL